METAAEPTTYSNGLDGLSSSKTVRWITQYTLDRLGWPEEMNLVEHGPLTFGLPLKQQQVWIEGDWKKEEAATQAKLKVRPVQILTGFCYDYHQHNMVVSLINSFKDELPETPK